MEYICRNGNRPCKWQCRRMISYAKFSPCSDQVNLKCSEGMEIDTTQRIVHFVCSRALLRSVRFSLKCTHYHGRGRSWASICPERGRHRLQASHCLQVFALFCSGDCRPSQLPWLESSVEKSQSHSASCLRNIWGRRRKEVCGLTFHVAESEEGEIYMWFSVSCC